MMMSIGRGTVHLLAAGCAIAFASVPIAANAQVRMVSTLGIATDYLSGGIMGGPNDCTVIPCATIAHAIAQATSPSDVVRLEYGPFNECNITVNKSITIRGYGPSRVQINANHLCRHFNIAPTLNATVTLYNLNLTNGRATDGGSILNNAGGNLTLNNVRIYDAMATTGGGLHNAGGTVQVRASVLEDNFAEEGAAIFTEEGDVTVSDTRVRNNTAGYVAGGRLRNRRSDLRQHGHGHSQRRLDHQR